ncbi:MAG TPA: hypothetical protein VKS24_24995 [Bradyrhizobium sp.]|nr:hypothetical protein [Bradyrhizobium sp.]
MKQFRLVGTAALLIVMIGIAATRAGVFTLYSTLTNGEIVIDQANPTGAQFTSGLLHGTSNGINAQTGTSYTIVGSPGAQTGSPLYTGDMGALVTFNNSSPVAVTLPQAGTSGFETNKWFDVENIGAGAVTITPTVSTINGSATLTIDQGRGTRIYSDGTNWQIMAGGVGLAGTPLTVPEGGTGDSTLTAHGVLLGQGTSAVTAVGPTTTGIPLIAKGATSDPAYGTAVVGGGGTGATTLTSHGVLVGEGTSAVVATTAGTAGQLLIGTASDPAFATPASALTLPGNPSAISPGTSTAQAFGLGANSNPSVLTPVATGRVYYSITFTVLIASTSNGATFSCHHGTGSAPANAATTGLGTADSAAVAYLAGATTEKAVITCSGIVTGATLSTALWFDVIALNTTGSQSITPTLTTFTAFEF